MAAESRADRLALELLAPAAAVRAALERHVPSGHPDELAERTVELLVEVFGLPLAAATPTAAGSASAGTASPPCGSGWGSDAPRPPAASNFRRAPEREVAAGD